MVKEKKSPKKRVIKKKVEEIFEVEKNGKEKIVKSSGVVEEKVSSKNQIETQNKILKNFLIGVGIIILIFGFWILFSYFQTNFTYQGIKFNAIQEGKTSMYHARLPVFYQGKNVYYNLYLRKNPKKSKINFEGDLNLKEMLVQNITGDFRCDGDGVVAVVNLGQSLGVLGTKVINDPNATCDSLGRYSFIKILPGNKTRIEKFGPSCYNFYVNNCEILDVTEKFIVESFVQNQNKLKSNQ